MAKNWFDTVANNAFYLFTALLFTGVLFAEGIERSILIGGALAILPIIAVADVVMSVIQKRQR